MVAAVFWNSDIASIPLLAGEMAHRAGGVLNLSVATYWSTFLFDAATRSLPFHRGIWAGFSLATSLLAALVLGWAARRAAGRAAGLLVLAIALCAGPIAFTNAYELRGPTWLTGALLAAGVVGLASGVTDRRWRWLAVAGIALLAAVPFAALPTLSDSGRLLLTAPSAAELPHGGALTAISEGALQILSGHGRPRDGVVAVPGRVP